MAFRLNHYVAEWYQRRFLPTDAREQKFYYLDKTPDTIVNKGHRYQRTDVLRWGPDRCFYQRDLYTARFGAAVSTEIEEAFFGPMDAAGLKAVEYFATFRHPSVEHRLFNHFLSYLSLQKLRTPKGLTVLADMVHSNDQNELLFRLQELHQMYCALWTECAWQIVDASQSPTKFIVSDHPVTAYNQACFPASKWCLEHRDPAIWWSGTHTLFPLSLDKLLILTNLSWVRNPYGNPMHARPNPELFRPAMLDVRAIQTERHLDEREVRVINHIIKQRALRYVAAAEKEWLYPERQIGQVRWDKLTERYFLMPDPRSMVFSTQIVVGYKSGPAQAYDEYGHHPGQPGFGDQNRQNKEMNSFLAFQGEFARLHGPKRRGRSFELDRLSPVEDDPDFHKYHLKLENDCKKRLG